MTNKHSIEGNFNFIVPTVVPSFVQGEDAKALYDKVRETIKSGVWYDENSKTMRGSSTFLAARVDNIVRNLGNGIRVASLADLSRPEIMEMVRGRHYSDAPAVVLRSIRDSYEPNNALIRSLVSKIEQRMGRLELPVLVTGFDVVPSDEKGYGLKLFPREDFAVLHDERLSEKYNGHKFSIVDENGLPIFDKKGNRTWYARDSGISRLYLDGGLSLGSGYVDYNLANSDEDGRVVLVRDAVASAEKKASGRKN